LPFSRIILISLLVLPTLLQDIIDRADKWGNEGKIDPFTEIYDVSLLENGLPFFSFFFFWLGADLPSFSSFLS